MTKGEDFVKKGKYKNKHCSPMSDSAWCDLNEIGNTIKLHDKCSNRKCICHTINTFTPHQYMLAGGLIKSRLQKNFNGTRKAWDSFIRPSLEMATPLTSPAVAKKTKNPQLAQITSSILKSLTGGKN